MLAKFNSNFIQIKPLVPLLVVYLSLIVLLSPDELTGDGLRHIKYATNLTHGFYTEADNPSLRNGPGYPLVIAVPLLFNATHLIVKLLNAFLLFGAVLFFFKSLRFFISTKKSVILSYIFGLYPPILKFMLAILAESLVLFLVCGFLFYFLKLHRNPNNKRLHIFLSGAFLGFLALTKVIFGYVILTLIACYLIFLIFSRSNKTKNSLLVLVISFMFCIPYLMYTYSVTGKAFVWGTQGGEMLYWRSSPFQKEQGNWTSIKSVLEDKPSDYFSNTILYQNHGEFIKELQPLSHLKRDSVFKAKALENIKNYPEKYIKNTAASAVRLFINYPYSYTPQKMSTLFYIIPGMFLLIFLFMAITIGAINWKLITFETRFLILLTLIFLGGLTLLDGRVRHSTPAIPILIFLIAFVFHQFTEVKIKGKITGIN